MKFAIAAHQCWHEHMIMRGHNAGSYRKANHGLSLSFISLTWARRKPQKNDD